MGTKETAMKLVTLLIAFSLFNAFCTKSTEEKSGSDQNEKKEVSLDQFENSVTSQNNGNFADLKTMEFDRNRKEKRDIGIKDLSSKEKRKKVQKKDKRVMQKRKGPKTSKGSRQKNSVKGRKRKTSQNSNSKKSKNKKKGRKVQKRQGPKEQKFKQKLERKKIRKRNLRINISKQT